ncbi:MAG: hypothetical protein Kow0092_06870 [Deferrisomatales bacterium]
MTKRTRPIIASILVLCLGALGALPARGACAGGCCAPPEPAVQAAHRAPGAMGAHGCCCGPSAVPCDLEQGRPEDPGPVAALTGPRSGAHSAPAAALAVLPDVPPGVPGALSPEAPSPRAAAPPGPLYLRNRSFLC